MILILDLDRTLNCLRPEYIRSIRDLAPPELARGDVAELWIWLTRYLQTVEHPPNRAAVEVLNQLGRRASSVIVNTGRPEATRRTTEQWLARYFRVDELYMRPIDDFRATMEVKRDHLLRRIMSNHDARELYAFDDNPLVVKMYRDHGLVALDAPDCWYQLLSWVGIQGRGALTPSALRLCAESRR